MTGLEISRKGSEADSDRKAESSGAFALCYSDRTEGKYFEDYNVRESKGACGGNPKTSGEKKRGTAV